MQSVLYFLTLSRLEGNTKENSGDVVFKWNVHGSEPVFVNVYGAHESIPMNPFRQPMLPGGAVRKIGLSYRPARLGIDSWAP